MWSACRPYFQRGKLSCPVFHVNCGELALHNFNVVNCRYPVMACSLYKRTAAPWPFDYYTGSAVKVARACARA